MLNNKPRYPIEQMDGIAGQLEFANEELEGIRDEIERAKDDIVDAIRQSSSSVLPGMATQVGTPIAKSSYFDLAKSVHDPRVPAKEIARHLDTSNCWDVKNVLKADTQRVIDILLETRIDNELQGFVEVCDVQFWTKYMDRALLERGPAYLYRLLNSGSKLGNGRRNVASALNPYILAGTLDALIQEDRYRTDRFGLVIPNSGWRNILSFSEEARTHLYRASFTYPRTDFYASWGVSWENMFQTFNEYLHSVPIDYSIRGLRSLLILGARHKYDEPKPQLFNEGAARVVAQHLLAARGTDGRPLYIDEVLSMTNELGPNFKDMVCYELSLIPQKFLNLQMFIQAPCFGICARALIRQLLVKVIQSGSDEQFRILSSNASYWIQRASCDS